jgi:hypothetical protein
MSNSELKSKIKIIEKSVLILVHQRYPTANIFSLGAIDINPKHLAIWITTDSDQQRDDLKEDVEFQKELVEILKNAQYPQEAIPHFGFAFESEETVKRDHKGNWRYVVQ